MYAPEHWSGSCRTCRTGCYGPALLKLSLKMSKNVRTNIYSFTRVTKIET